MLMRVYDDVLNCIAYYKPISLPTTNPYMTMNVFSNSVVCFPMLSLT